MCFFNCRSHGNSSEYYFERARSLKREADAITVSKGTNEDVCMTLKGVGVVYSKILFL